MKKIISLFLVIGIAFSCVHAQTTTPTTINPTASTVDSGVMLAAVDASVNSELPPLPVPQPLPRIVTDGGMGPNGELIAPLSVDVRTPFSGVLFNGPALAYLEVEYRAVQQRCLIDRRRETEEVVARYQAQLERLQVSLDSTIAQHRVIVSGRDREIESLNRVITQQTNSMSLTPLQTMLYIGGGLLVGTLITGTTAYVLTRP